MVALAAVTVACSDSTAPPSPGDSPAGAFALSMVDDKPLPVTILSETGYTLEVTASTAQLETNGQFTIAVTTRETVAGHASVYVDSLRGTWTHASGQVTLTLSPSGPSSEAEWDGQELAVPLVVATASGRYVFRKSD